MSQKYVILSALICVSLGYDDPRDAKILDYQLEHTHTGHYFFRFESSDGTTREEEGNVLDENVEDSPVIMKGSYSYTDATGKVYTVRYTADENGFHPEGDHIKVPAYVVNDPDPVNFVLSPTSRPRPSLFVQTTPRPQFIPALPTRFQNGPFPPTTTRTEGSTEPTRIQIPVDPTVATDRLLDQKLQSSIVNLLANGNGRGFSVRAVKI